MTPARADPGTLYVDGAIGSDSTDCSDPAAPCATIGYALTRAGNGDEILVAAGTYTETLDVEGAPITLRGGYTISGTAWLPRGETIIDANGADSPVITFHPGNNVTVEGFTIQGANHTFGEGGGFWINASTIVISDTVIRDNATVGPGSGVWIENSVGAENIQVSLINSTVISNNATNGSAGLTASGGDSFQVSIENTVFTGNTGYDVLNLDQTFEIVGGQVSSNTVTGYCAIGIGGSGSSVISGTEIMSNTSQAMIIWGPDNVVSAHNLTIQDNAGGVSNNGILTLTNSIVENNSGDDAPVIFSENENFPETNRLVLDNCTIRDNGTPGIVGISTGYAALRNTRIIGNKPANSGIINSSAGEVSLVNMLIADNETQQGHILGQYAGTATVMNVTLANNDTNGDQQAVATEGVMTITNTIVWGNKTGEADALGGQGEFIVSYSNIQGGWPDTGNIDAAPRFVDAANGDYHLGVGSPCINAGTPAGAPLTDIEGTPRDAAPDMGAYEWTGSCP